jgi:hypothetical protein
MRPGRAGIPAIAQLPIKLAIGNTARKRMDKLIGSESTPGQQITDIHCWIATYADGTEGIIAGGIEGLGLTTLVSSRRHVAEKMEPIARRAQRMTMHTQHRVVSIRLVTFTTTEGTRQ